MQQINLIFFLQKMAHFLFLIEEELDKKNVLISLTIHYRTPKKCLYRKILTHRVSQTNMHHYVFSNFSTSYAATIKSNTNLNNQHIRHLIEFLRFLFFYLVITPQALFAPLSAQANMVCDSPIDLSRYFWFRCLQHPHYTYPPNTLKSKNSKLGTH